MKKMFLLVVSVLVLAVGLPPAYASGFLTVSERPHGRTERVKGEIADVGKDYLVVNSRRLTVSSALEISADTESPMEQNIRSLAIGQLVEVTLERGIVTKIMVIMPQ